MTRYTDAAVPFWDAFITMVSVISQWLQARKILESWSGWMIVNAVALGVYGAKGLYWFAVLYAVFPGLAVTGLRAWVRSWRKEQRG